MKFRTAVIITVCVIGFAFGTGVLVHCLVVMFKIGWNLVRLPS